MVNPTTCYQRKQLEKIWVQSPKKEQRFSQLKALFYQAFQHFCHYLIRDQQPRVWQVSRQGVCDWNAYDPVNHCRVEGLSESEMRAWLEERYNR